MNQFIPYGRQCIDEEDIAAVVEALRSDFITTGPKVGEFEKAIANYCGAKYGVAVANGTAALHSAMNALGIGPGDEVIVPPITFVASCNCVIYQGGTPIFADVLPDTLLIDPQKVREAITPRTRAIVGVDYAGQTCDWDELRRIAEEAGIPLVADSCHALGATHKNEMTGNLADITVFSFHPVKHITTGEGGMALTNSAGLAEKMRVFRGHGITSTAYEREKNNSWSYDMVDLGYNYRITDLQCALGLSQLKKLPEWLEKRNRLADKYDELLAGSPVVPLARRVEDTHAYHLYVVRTPDRDRRFAQMRKRGIGANVHYRPAHLHPYYRKKYGYGEGLCPVAEKAGEEILTLPLWPGMKDEDVERVVGELLADLA